MKIEIVLFFVIVTALFSAGFYYVQKRFWPQDRNNSRTAPLTPPEGAGNEMDDKNPIWRPPKAG